MHRSRPIGPLTPLGEFDAVIVAVAPLPLVCTCTSVLALGVRLPDVVSTILVGLMVRVTGVHSAGLPVAGVVEPTSAQSSTQKGQTYGASPAITSQ